MLYVHDYVCAAVEDAKKAIEEKEREMKKAEKREEKERRRKQYELGKGAETKRASFNHGSTNGTEKLLKQTAFGALPKRSAKPKRKRLYFKLFLFHVISTL